MTDRTDSWAIEQFSQANPQGDPRQGDVATLLRRVADSLERLGDVEVQDLVLHPDLDDDGEDRPSVTVYFHRSDPDE